MFGVVWCCCPFLFFSWIDRYGWCTCFYGRICVDMKMPHTSVCTSTLCSCPYAFLHSHPPLQIFGFLHIQLDHLGVPLSMFGLSLLLLLLYVCSMAMIHMGVFGRSPTLNSALCMVHALLLTFVESMLYLGGVYPVGMFLLTWVGGSAMCFGASTLFRESVEVSLLGHTQVDAHDPAVKSRTSTRRPGAELTSSLLRSLGGCVHLAKVVVLLDPEPMSWLAQLSVALMLFVVMAAIAFANHALSRVFLVSIFLVALAPLRICFLQPLLLGDSWDQVGISLVGSVGV
jgi:hypothetical protein